MAAFLYEFEWDPAKAQTNIAKHGLDFERAAMALTIPDDEHSGTEPRWITTIGEDATSRYVLVVHTFEWPPTSGDGSG